MIIYGVIVWYVDNIRPGPYGIAKPWYFIFQGCKKEEEIQFTPEQTIELCEKPLPYMNIGLSVKNLRKVYDKSYVAVDGISIDFYNGQITALLGHNGAGKTTTMSMISGMISPTAGAVYKHESNEDFYDIFQNMERFRQQLGLCPQEDMFYPGFTIMDHLIFFGLLRGLSSRNAEENGNDILSLLNMAHTSEKKADVLSKGMKRKLSLAISIISEPQVLILDEPSSGLDPESRRAFWNVLLELRENRTIIITTHFMEEAEVLGDRIAIMDHGRICCYGTTIYLKNVYGAGYYLTLQVGKTEHIQNISKIVSTNVHGSKIIRIVNNQITFILPTEQSRNFASLFASLESSAKEYGISNIGVSCTTMEEVFLKVGELEKMKKTKQSNSRKSATSAERSKDENLASKSTGSSLSATTVSSSDEDLSSESTGSSSSSSTESSRDEDLTSEKKTGIRRLLWW
ncbi:phospholipid-transporting ATPase ABCA3-like [Lycorma delicatula]|uniref:phospholipid-transporting ATPase ABCA3-like n=1 Tax=Lycorma delicatula TaxID=130591 RepID=UPI003F510E23